MKWASRFHFLGRPKSQVAKCSVLPVPLEIGRPLRSGLIAHKSPAIDRDDATALCAGVKRKAHVRSFARPYAGGLMRAACGDWFISTSIQMRVECPR
jgi:hypothetical protein